MNLRKLSLKLAVLTMGVVVLSYMAIPAKATLFCVPAFCQTSTSVGQCGDGRYEDCAACYGDDGSIEYSADCSRN